MGVRGSYCGGGREWGGGGSRCSGTVAAGGLVAVGGALRHCCRGEGALCQSDICSIQPLQTSAGTRSNGSLHVNHPAPTPTHTPHEELLPSLQLSVPPRNPVPELSSMGQVQLLSSPVWDRFSS